MDAQRDEGAVDEATRAAPPLMATIEGYRDISHPPPSRSLGPWAAGRSVCASVCFIDALWHPQRTTPATAAACLGEGWPGCVGGRLLPPRCFSARSSGGFSVGPEAHGLLLPAMDERGIGATLQNKSEMLIEISLTCTTEMT